MYLVKFYDLYYHNHNAVSFILLREFTSVERFLCFPIFPKISFILNKMQK